MNISINLNTEQQAAADTLLEEYNNLLKSKLTKEEFEEQKLSESQYFETIVNNIINDKVELLFKNSAQRLVDASKNLPYEARIALIAEVESKLF